MPVSYTHLLDDIAHAMRSHACNLGCLIAAELAALLPGCRAFIADPGVVDELDEIARITGSPLMPRITIWHALNQRAIALSLIHIYIIIIMRMIRLFIIPY